MLGPGIGQREPPLGFPGRKVCCRLSHLGPLCPPVIGRERCPAAHGLPLPRPLPASLFSAGAHSTPEMLLEDPAQQPWQQLDSRGVLPPPAPWKLGQAVPGYFSWAWPWPRAPGSPPSPQGPGAKEVGRAGSPLPWGCLSTSLVWSCHVSSGLSPVSKVKLDPPVLLPACPRPCLQGVSCL